MHPRGTVGQPGGVRSSSATGFQGKYLGRIESYQHVQAGKFRVVGGEAELWKSENWESDRLKSESEQLLTASGTDAEKNSIPTRLRHTEHKFWTRKKAGT